jgi:radical SAM superfamily enzyme YgiQ (UPF0313 family)
MKILLVYPEIPATFWSFKNAVKFISKRSGEPPLGLITIAAMLPEEWTKKVVDMNVSVLTMEHLQWADYLFISGMNIQRKSFEEVVKRANQISLPVVAGGPMVTTDYKEFSGIDHFILNEAEITLPPFINDLKNGTAQTIYSSNEFPELSQTPVPLWHLLEMKKYANMSIQYSRGCPYNCEFCSITLLNGHMPRTKDAAQFLNELDSLYDHGWRGGVFVVDDNFIGNKKKLKNDLLPALIEWQKMHRNVFSFGTEASINLAADDELMRLMAMAGFDHAFIGVESPNYSSLQECGKSQNLKCDMLTSVQKMHSNGLRVSAGFIIGFDNDPADIFDQQINFIRNSGIVTAMIGLLNAPTGTRLFDRLKKENRLVKIMSGDNMDGSINFIPKMNHQKLTDGYKRVLETVYNPKEYYYRVKLFLKEFQPRFQKSEYISWQGIKALFKSFWILGIARNGQFYFWKLFFLSVFRFPRKFPLAIKLAIYGFHFRQVIKTV